MSGSLLLFQVKESLLEVELCDERSAHCHIANEKSDQGTFRFPKHSSEETVVLFSLLIGCPSEKLFSFKLVMVISSFTIVIDNFFKNLF